MIRFYKAMMMKSVWMCTGRDIINRAFARELSPNRFRMESRRMICRSAHSIRSIVHAYVRVRLYARHFTTHFQIT